MSTPRADILGRIQGALGRGPLDEVVRARLDRRLAAPARNIVPARAQIPAVERVELFVAMAEEADATVARVDSLEDVPAALADYLARENLPARFVMAAHPLLDAVPWSSRPTLEFRHGVPTASDEVGLAAAFAGVAETGTLVMISGPASPTTLNFLPETHVVVLPAERVVGPFEDAFDLVRETAAGGLLPRTVNLITGPSRSADIEQKLQMGAHGPRRLHVILLGAPADA